MTRSRICAPAPGRWPTSPRRRTWPLVQVPAVDASGRDKAGNPVRPARARCAGGSRLRLRYRRRQRGPAHRHGGYVWYDVTGIEPAREKTLDEVRDAGRPPVAGGPGRPAPVREGAATDGAARQGRDDRGRGAGSRRRRSRTPTDLARNDREGRSRRRGGQPHLRDVPVGKAGNAPNGTDARAVFKVTAATVPPLVTTTQEAKSVEDQLRDRHRRRPDQPVHRPGPQGPRRDRQPAGAAPGDRRRSLRSMIGRRPISRPSPTAYAAGEPVCCARRSSAIC